MPVEFLVQPDSEAALDEAGPREVPAGAYRDPARYAAEVDGLLGRSWVVAAHSSAVRPDRLAVWDGFGQTVVVCRDDDGRLTAFANVCQHRGARLAEDGAPCPGGQVVCPWHGFTYDRAGQLVAVPRRASFDRQLVDDLRAPTVAVAEFAGLVWINLAGDAAEPFGDWIGDLAGELGDYGMDAWCLVGERRWPVAANWKAVIEGFSEDYHARVVHDETIPSGLMYDGTQIRLLGRHSMMVTPLASVDYDALVPPVDHRRHAYCHYSAFPATIFSCFPTHAQVMSMVPLAVDRTELRVQVVARPEAPVGTDQARYDRRMASGVDHFAAIAAEDLSVLDRLATTASATGYRRNVYSRLEARISRFHRAVDDVLGPYDLGPSGPASNGGKAPHAD